MERKIYVAGMDDDATASKVDAAVKAVAGVSDCVSTAAKCQVLVTYDENAAGIDDAIANAISSTGVTVLG